MKRVFLLECDAPDGCTDFLIVTDEFERAAVARFKANEAGWTRAVDYSGQWYCPRHSNRASDRGLFSHFHDIWCAWHTGGLCCCRRSMTVPPTGMDTYGQGIKRYSTVERVKGIDEGYL